MNFHILFIPGYRTKDNADYCAQNAVMSAVKEIPHASMSIVEFPREKLGRYETLPSFQEMVKITQTIYKLNTPTIMVGHCIGGALAAKIAANQEVPAPAGIVMLCPPVGRHPAAAKRKSEFRIFGYPTGIPRGLLTPKNYRGVIAGKEHAVLASQEILLRLSPEKARFPLSNLAFLSASRDRECDGSYTKRLAHVLGSPHHEIDDTHSLRSEEAVSVIRGLVTGIMDRYRNYPELRELLFPSTPSTVAPLLGAVERPEVK